MHLSKFIRDQSNICLSQKIRLVNKGTVDRPRAEKAKPNWLREIKRAKRVDD